MFKKSSRHAYFFLLEYFILILSFYSVLSRFLLDNYNNYRELHSAELTEALQRRQAYFESLPAEQKEKALEFQNFINEELRKAGNQGNRLCVLRHLMQEHLKALHTNCTLLAQKLKDFSQHSP